MTVPKFKKFKIEAYKPGKSNIAKIRNIIKLSANESACTALHCTKRNETKLNLTKLN